MPKRARGGARDLAIDRAVIGDQSRGAARICGVIATAHRGLRRRCNEWLPARIPSEQGVADLVLC